MPSHKERILAALRGELLDRPPIALWRHFPVDDQSPERLAAATLHWQQTFDWDLVKITPASSFCLRDWGVQDVWEGHPEGTRRYTYAPIQKPADWERLQPLTPDAPGLAAQLDCIRQLRQALGPEVPLVQTVFSPLAQAKNLVGRADLARHIRLHPEALSAGLTVIAQTTRQFITAALEAGADGVFYAVQHAQASLLTHEEFARFGRAFDLQVLQAAEGWLNLAHIHGNDIYFDLVADYPVQVLNWHDRENIPTLGAGQQQSGKVVCGGLRRETVSLGTPDAIRAEAEDARQQTGGKHFILGTGCVVDVVAPYGNLRAVREVWHACD